MAYVFLAFFLFSVLVVAHIFFCRITIKQGLHAKAFIFLAIVFLVVFFASALTLQHSNMLDPHSLWGLPFKITAAIIFILLGPIYLCFYVLTQLTSPSKKILMTISQCGEAGYADIINSIQKENFISTRLNDLRASGCVTQVEDRYVLTTEGRKIAATLNLMQSILGRNVGG